jgi:hypothetical protein
MFCVGEIRFDKCQDGGARKGKDPRVCETPINANNLASQKNHAVPQVINAMFPPCVSRVMEVHALHGICGTAGPCSSDTCTTKEPMAT